jgi:hypothetical protein
MFAAVSSQEHCPGVNLLEASTFLNHQHHTGLDAVCIVENITEPWLAVLGDSLGLPTAFLAWHLRFHNEPTQQTTQVLARELITLIEDVMERCLRLTRATNVSSTSDTSLLTPLDGLSESLASANSVVAAWSMSGLHNAIETAEEKYREKIALMLKVRDHLRGVPAMPFALRAAELAHATESVVSALRVFETRRFEQWYSLTGYVDDADHGSRLVNHKGKNSGNWKGIQLSYIRPRKSLRKPPDTCIPPSLILASPRACRQSTILA